MTLERDGDRWSVSGAWYRLAGRIDGPVATLDDHDGFRWAELRLLGSADTLGGVDETLAIRGPKVEADDGEVVRLVWTLESTLWATKRLVIEAGRETLGVTLEVEPRAPGLLTEVTLLGGRVVLPKTTGLLMSGAWFESIVAAAPADPARIVQPATESTILGVVSGSEHGRGRWFFTPPPFVVAASRAPVDDPIRIAGGPWLSFSLDAVAGAAGFTEFAYCAIDRGFSFVVDYDAHTQIDRKWASPPLVIGRAADPYDAIAAQRARFDEARLAGTGERASLRQPRPSWWLEPIFCGWGAQCALATSAGQTMAAAAGLATQANYDAFLGHLEARGVVPGTVMIDDKWQATYGANEPDTAKWPDLRSWIAGRHARNQRVLLWYKAWDAEGLSAEWCVRSPSGFPIGIDPTNPAAERAIRQSVASMLGPDGLDADGLKIDFTARTPSGRGATHHGPEWGADLLRRLLEIVADEAHRTRPEALLVGHTPSAIVAPAIDMIRLNDALRLDDPEPARDIVPSMRHRAAIVRAACPDHPVDTDDWCAPDLAGWRAYNAIKGELGVPALYYATHLDRSGEQFEDEDYALLRRVWSGHRRSVGLPDRAAAS